MVLVQLTSEFAPYRRGMLGVRRRVAAPAPTSDEAVEPPMDQQPTNTDLSRELPSGKSDDAPRGVNDIRWNVRLWRFTVQVVARAPDRSPAGVAAGVLGLTVVGLILVPGVAALISTQ